MTIQSDKWIKKQKGMIEPFFDHQIKASVKSKSVISFGLTSYGYDIRLAPELKLFDKYSDRVINPKQFDDSILTNAKLETDNKGGEFFILPPHGFALGRSVESFKIPRDILVVCVGKSTYARCALIVNITPLEPMWEGEITLEFSNTTDLPIMLFANEGITQLLFLKGDEPCDISYADRNGKYQGQKGITLPK